VVFIQSKAFTRRFLELADGAADSVLSNLQGALLDNPLRGDMVRGPGAFASRAF
jgi:hypothetical protein